MTIIVAAVKGNKGVIAADTLIVSKEKKVKGLKNFTKIVEFPHFLVGFGGDCSIFPIIHDFSVERSYLKRAHMKMRNQKDALKFSKDVFEMLQGNLECSPTFDKDDEDAMFAEMLILSKKGSIYELEPGMSVTEPSDFAAIGSGEDIALGAMKVLYDRHVKDESDLKKCVEDCIIITCDLSANCSLPMDIIEITIP